MGRYRNILPDGGCDLLFKECEARRAVESSLSETFRMRGYSEVVTPSLEFFDVFSGKSPVMDADMMYKLIDGHGRILVLRPDNTTPIARVASTKLKGFVPPLRLYYNQNVFRISPYMSGRYDEVAQCGVELIGAGGETADVEVILTAASALKKVLGKDFRFEIGHVGYYKAIIDELPFGEEEKEEIRDLIASKSYASLGEKLAPYEDRNAACQALAELPRFFGGSEVLDRAQAVAPNDTAAATIGCLRSLYDTLCAAGLRENLMLDLGMVQQIDYYTGLVFRGYMHGSGEPVLSGGRYDTLLSDFGQDMPACGFAVNADAIARVAARHLSSGRPDCLIFAEPGRLKEAFGHMDALIADGLVCEMSLAASEPDSAEYARTKGIRRMDVVGQLIRTVAL